MDFVNSIKQAIEIVKLNGKAAKNVSKDKNATLIGILIIAIGSVLSNVLMLKIVDIISTLIIGVIGYFIIVGIMHIIARLFGGQAKYLEYFRAQSHASILSWLGILAVIPTVGSIINFFIAIWSLIVWVVILESVHKLTRGKAIVVVLLIITLFIFIGTISHFGAANPDALMP